MKQKARLIRAVPALLLAVLLLGVTVSAQPLSKPAVAYLGHADLTNSATADFICSTNTHVIYLGNSYSKPTLNADGSLNTDRCLPQAAQIASIVHARGVKLTMYIPSATGGALSAIVQDATKRAAFVSSVVSFCQSNSVDGVSIDWEAPTSAELPYFTTLLGQLYAATPPGFVISNYLSNAVWALEPGAAQYLNWIDVGSYHGSGPNGIPTLAEAAADMSNAASHGYPPSKLLMGLPFYLGDNVADVQSKVDWVYLNGFGGMMVFTLNGTTDQNSCSQALTTEAQQYELNSTSLALAPVLDGDIGTVGPAGNASETGGTYTVAGAGSDIGGTADSFNYAYESMTGDGAIVVRLTAETGTITRAKVGVMMRADSTPGSRYAAVVLNNGYGTTPPTARFSTRATAGGSAAWKDGPTGNSLPVWFKLARVGNTFTGYVSQSSNGSWVTVGSATIAMPNTFDVGLAVCSRNSTALTTATFDSVWSSWKSGDIGTVGTAGSASELGGTFTMTGAGSDLGGTADSFQYAEQTHTGDGTIVARLTADTGATGIAKAGVMMRADSTPGSQYVAVLLDNSFGTARLTTRATAGAYASWTSGIGITLPQWFKLVRAGNIFTGYMSPDGVNWTTLGSSYVTMPMGMITAGMAVTSRNTAAPVTVTFDNAGVW